MPTSEPWNPNPANLETYSPCPACDEGGCVHCDGRGFFTTTVEYRPDKKIRCQVGLPSGSLSVAFWDDAQIADFKYRVNHASNYMYPVRGFDFATYEIRPSAVCLFRRMD